MDDLISRAEAIARIDKCVTLSGIGCEPVMAVRDIKALISVLPAVDAAQVVRCRDCKYCYGIDNDPMTPYDGDTDWYCEEFDVDWHVLTLDPNRFYCANGERRDEDAVD